MEEKKELNQLNKEDLNKVSGGTGNEVLDRPFNRPFNRPDIDKGKVTLDQKRPEFDRPDID